MTKNNAAQIFANTRCEQVITRAEMEIQSAIYHFPLRSCKADVLESDNYLFLKSYNTIVAIIDKKTGDFYDVLRKVYGYTSTSAQHIWKFRKDYSHYITGASYQWRNFC